MDISHLLEMIVNGSCSIKHRIWWDRGE